MAFSHLVGMLSIHLFADAESSWVDRLHSMIKEISLPLCSIVSPLFPSHRLARFGLGKSATRNFARNFTEFPVLCTAVLFCFPGR